MLTHLAFCSKKSIPVVLLLLSCCFSRAQLLTEAVSGPRPLDTALVRLVSIYGIPINYEDSAANSTGGRVTIEQTDSSSSTHNTVEVEKLSLSYQTPQSLTSWKGDHRQFEIESRQAAANALARLVKSYHLSQGKEALTIEEKDGMFIVRKTYANRSSGRSDTEPISETRVTIAPAVRTRAELVNEVCESLTKAADIRVDCSQAISVGNMDVQTSVTGADLAVSSLLNRLVSELNVYPKMGTAYVFGPSGAKIPKQAVFNGPRLVYSWSLRYVSGGFYMLYIDHAEVADQ
jgi:hypothetical protein